MSGFGKTTTTDEVLAGKDLSGVRVFVTGATSGLGKETVRAMAAKGAHVMLAGRNQETLDTTVAEIKSAHPDARLDTIVCDLASLDSVRACGAQARERMDAIDLLINNAGVMATPLTHTKDGFESQFGTNHLGHFVLTKELMPLVQAGNNKRIVNLSSRGHQIAPVNLDDPNFENREYDPFQSYGHSKTANVLFSVGLEARFADKGVHAYAVHPGGINTNLGRHMDEKMQEGLMANILANEPDFQFKTEAQGAATSCWAATAQELEGKGGLYCEDCHVAQVDDESKNGGVRSYAVDSAAADKLWTLSEELTGTVFTA